MKRKISKAFTLVEIMAASAIMTVIVLVVLSIANTVLRTWNRASGQLQTMFEGGVAGGIMQEDFEGIKIKKDGRAWLQVAYPYSVGMLTGDNYLDSVPLKPPEVMFYSQTVLRPRYTQNEMSKLGMEADMTQLDSKDTRRPEEIPGSVCAIKYQLALKNPFMKGSGKPTTDEQQYNAFYGLYRAVIDPQSTALEGMGFGIQGFAKSDSEAANTEWAIQQNLWQKTCAIIDELGIRQAGQNLKSWSVAPENLLAMNVVDLRLTFGVFYPNPKARGNDNEAKYDIAYIPPATPFTIGKRIITDVAYRISSSGERESISGNEIADGFLGFVDVSMTIMSDSGAAEMRALMHNGKLTQDKFRNMILEYGTTVTRRIQLEAEPE